MRTLHEIRSVAINHMESGTLELGDKVSSNLVSSYTDASVFENEIKHINRGRPLPFLPSDSVSEPEDPVLGVLHKTSLIAVRSREGILRVFLNACRHRGAQLNVESGKGEGCKKLVCPFHGWSYGLDGESSESSAFRLKEIPSYEYAGMIWVILDPRETSANIEDSFLPLKTDLAELGFLPAHALPERSFTTNFNWKIGVEAFLEVYHFAHAHAPYLSQLQFPNLSLADAHGANYRIVVPLKKPQDNQSILSWSQVMYFIFPSSFLLFYDDHVALISLVPISIGQTQFRYIPLVPRQEDLTSERIKQKVEFLDVIIGQDISILEGIQKGLQSQANTRFTFTRLEHLLGEFHKNLGGKAN